MKKNILLSFCLLFSAVALMAQDDEDVPEKGFKKENLFTGGSISLGFGSQSFTVGANPVFGYSITNWLDGGIVVNYNYTSYRDYPYSGDKQRQSVYGGGAFVRAYPINFLFVQAQAEHNFLSFKQTYSGGISGYSGNYDATSLLLGAGYAGGRFGRGNSFFYISISVDVLQNVYSPYTDSQGEAIPILKAGVQVALFQGKNRNY